MIEKSSDKSSERTSDVAVSDIDKEEDKDKERDIRGNRVDYQQIADMYNATCVSFPRLTRLSEKRKRAIKARLRKYSIDDIKKVFELAEESDFLKGENNRNWSATFDWMMNDANMAKILDGNYKNKDAKQSKPPVSRNLNNFDRREYDMDSLEEQLLNSN